MKYIFKYFSLEQCKKFLDTLSEGEYMSKYHKKFVNQLPKDLNDITPEDFHKGSEILSSSMANVSVWLTAYGCLCLFMAVIGVDTKETVAAFFITEGTKTTRRQPANSDSCSSTSQGIGEVR